jgi:hypothetical protein
MQYDEFGEYSLYEEMTTAYKILGANPQAKNPSKT